MIRRHTDVRGSFLDHLQHRMQHADDCAEGPILAFVEAAQPIEVTEQLVRAVNEVNDHGGGGCAQSRAGFDARA